MASSHPLTTRTHHKGRPLLVASLVAWGMVLLIGLNNDFTWRVGSFGVRDWIAYWSFPRALLLGAGYGDPAALESIQASLGYTVTFLGTRPIPFIPLWNLPPLVIPLLPLAALDFSLATMGWLGMSAMLFLDSALRVNFVLRSPLPTGVAVGVSLLVSTFLAALVSGQPTIILAAFVLYAWLAQRRGKPLAAGILLVPLFLKPHLFFVALILLSMAALRQRQAALLLGLLGGLGGLTVALFLLDPSWPERRQQLGLPLDWQTLAPADLAVRFLNLPAVLTLGALAVGVIFALVRYRQVCIVSLRLLGEAMLLSLAFSPYVHHNDLVVWLPVALWLSAVLWYRRQAWLLLFPALILFIPLPLEWLRRLAIQFLPLAPAFSPQRPVRVFLFVASVVALWLWLRRAEPEPAAAAPRKPSPPYPVAPR